MAFGNPELELIDNVVGGLCRKLNHLKIKDLSIEYRVEKQDVIIFEKRPAWDQPNAMIETPAAKFRFNRTNNECRLLWMRADLKWHSYQPLSSSVTLTKLVNEGEADPYGCFWGKPT
jgi:hypothetical protein